MLTNPRGRSACLLLVGMALPLACGDDSTPRADGGRQPGTGGLSGSGGSGGGTTRLDGSTGSGGSGPGGSFTGGTPGTDGAGPTDVAPSLDGLVPDRGTDGAAHDTSAPDANLATVDAVDVPSPQADAWSNPHAIDAEPILRVGSCNELLDWSQSIDDAAKGYGACANVTAGALIAQIRADRPDLADILRASVHDGGCMTALECPGPTDIKVLRHGDGFRLVLNRNGDFSMTKYHSQEYWYFETDASCYPEYVGHFLLNTPPDCSGSGLWGYPGLFCVPALDAGPSGPSTFASCARDGSTGQ